MNVLARVAAVLVAIGLVVGGLTLRDRGAPGTTDGSGDGASGTDVDEVPATFACTDDLGELCLELARTVGSDLEVASPDQLVDRLVADEPVVWLAPRGWADLVDDARVRGGLPPLARSQPVASTPLLLLGWSQRLAVLADACGIAVDAMSWDCVGRFAGRDWTTLGGDVRWGTVRPGHAPPDTGLGLPGTAAVVAGRTGLGFSLQDLRDEAGWFRDVERAVVDHTPNAGRHPVAMLLQGPSAADVAIATGAEAGPVLERGSSFGDLVAVAAEPLTAVELVLVGPDADTVAVAADRLDTDAVDDVLLAAGWDVGAAASGAVEVASGGALTALRTAWGEAAR